MNFFISIFVCISLVSSSLFSLERRGTIDVGSGSTKVVIADVDNESETYTILFEESFSVPYQASLEASYDGCFDLNVREKGMDTFNHIQSLFESYQVEKIAAVATAAFREATNGESFAASVREKTKIPLKIISQREEGILAFCSGVLGAERKADEVVVWDIGTGSFQMTALNGEGDPVVFMGGLGSIPFRNYIIDVVQRKDSNEIDSPNPMTKEEVHAADVFARSFGRKAYPLIKDKIKSPEVSLIGIGRLFSASIAPKSQGDEISRKDLRSYIESSLMLTDEEMGNPFAHVDVPNAIIVLAFMKALHIKTIQIVDTKTSRGMLLYAPYWEN